jgi:hypothetical protein
VSDEEKNHFPTVKILKTGNGGVSWTLQALPAQSIGFNAKDVYLWKVSFAGARR